MPRGTNDDDVIKYDRTREVFKHIANGMKFIDTSVLVKIASLGRLVCALGRHLV